MSRSDQPRLAILGGGPVGLALAGASLVYGCHWALLYVWHQEAALLLPMLVLAFTLLLENIRALRQGAKRDQLARLHHPQN